MSHTRPKGPSPGTTKHMFNETVQTASSITKKKKKPVSPFISFEAECPDSEVRWFNKHFIDEVVTIHSTLMHTVLLIMTDPPADIFKNRQPDTRVQPELSELLSDFHSAPGTRVELGITIILVITAEGKSIQLGRSEASHLVPIYISTTSEKARREKKHQERSNPAPELIACSSLARSPCSFVYRGS